MRFFVAGMQKIAIATCGRKSQSQIADMRAFLWNSKDTKNRKSQIAVANRVHESVGLKSLKDWLKTSAICPVQNVWLYVRSTSSFQTLYVIHTFMGCYQCLWCLLHWEHTSCNMALWSMSTKISIVSRVSIEVASTSLSHNKPGAADLQMWL